MSSNLLVGEAVVAETSFVAPVFPTGTSYEEVNLEPDSAF
jgi:hypothetical protein